MYEAAETGSMPVLEKNGRGQVSGNCPERIPGAEAYCWKFKNPDPAAQYDFWMILTLQRLGDMMLVSKLIPLTSGELLRFVRYNEYLKTMQSSYIKKIRYSHSDYGIVQISHLKVQEYYEGIIQTIFTSRFKVLRHDSAGNLIDVKTTSSFDFPPLPKGNPDTRNATPEYVMSQLGLRNIVPQDTIYFPNYDVDAQGEITVDNGDEFKAGGSDKRSLAASLATRPPGIYVDFAQQSGSPHLIMEIYSMVAEGGTSKILSGMFCTSKSYCYQTVREHIFKKKKKSWFRTKTKIKIVREELKLNIEGVKCSDI
jgi:hypothetical protein